MHFRISLSNQSRQSLVEHLEGAYQAANLRLVKRIHALLYIVDDQAELITAGPEAAGYPSGCWTAVIVQDLILRCFHVVYHPHYICHLLDQLGFSFQKARFVSDHLDEAARSRWLTET